MRSVLSPSMFANNGPPKRLSDREILERECMAFDALNTECKDVNAKGRGPFSAMTLRRTLVIRGAVRQEEFDSEGLKCA